MNIVTSGGAGALRYTAPTAPAASPAQTKESKDEENKPSALDAFSSGANKGANVANTILGAWNGGIAGAFTGGAIALGTNVISAAAGAITGSNPLSWTTLIDTATSTGLWALGGGAVGAVAGGVILNKTGDFTGGIGANVARKLGGNENLGRAIGTLAPSVALGTIVGTSVLGWNGAVIALGAGAIGGGLAYLKS